MSERYYSDTYPERLEKTSVYDWVYRWDIQEEEKEVEITNTKPFTPGVPELPVQEIEELDLLALNQPFAPTGETEEIEQSETNAEVTEEEPVIEQESTQSVTDPEEKVYETVTVYSFYQVIISEPITSNRVISEVITETMDINYEQKLINEYNEAVINGGETEEDKRKIAKYTEWLDLRNALKTEAEEICHEHGIE